MGSVVHVIAYGAEVDVLDHETRYDYSEEHGAYEKRIVECLDLTCAGFDREPCKLQILAARAINRELDQYDFSHYLPREAVAVLERIGKDGRRGEKGGRKSVITTINRITKEFVVAACRELAIDLGPYPTKPEGDDSDDSDYDTAVEKWYDKCPLTLVIDYVKEDEHGSDICATIYVKSTKFLRESNYGGRRYVGGNFGPGVDSRRLNMDVSEDQKRAITAVLAALHLKTKRPPGWIRITVATGYGADDRRPW